MAQPDLLSVNITKPLEREFEAWTIQEIEKYFLKLGCPINVWAVSPKDENSWPSDEAFEYRGKIIGLQFKRPDISDQSKGRTPLQRLRWKLNNPPRQYSNIANAKGIYYCLPTFINRKYKRVSLHHCVFWRPNKRSDNYIFWYDNSRSHGDNYNKHLVSQSDVYRWGGFVEEIRSCKLGDLIKDKADFNGYFDAVRRAFGVKNEKISDVSPLEGELLGYVIYFLYLSI